MDAAVERRTRGGRIPFDVMVELAYASDDQVERLEADGLDLGVGGMRVRTPFLPDPGTRLAARFEDPVTQEMLRAEGEVAWARDDVGELGLHFTKLNADAQRALARLVAPIDDEPAAAPDLPVEPPARTEEPVAAKPEEVVIDYEEEEPPRPARLVVEGVDTPLRVSVQHMAEDLVTLSSDLGFLRIGARAFVDAGKGLERSGVVASIDLEQSGDADVPRLVVGVVFDPRDHKKAAPAKRNQSTPASATRVAVESRPAPRAAEPPPPMVQSVAQSAPAPQPSARRDATPAHKPASHVEARATEARPSDAPPGRKDSTVSFASGGTRNAASPELEVPLPSNEDAEIASAMRPKWMTDVSRISKSARSVAVDGLKKGATKARPALSWLGARILAFLSTAFASLGAGGKRLFAKIAERASRPKKRTTAPAPAPRESIASARRRAEIEPPARKIDFKTIALGLTSAAAVVLAVYALWPRDEQPDRFDVHREMAAAPASPSAGAPSNDPAAGPGPAPVAAAAPSAAADGEGDLAPPIEDDGEGGEPGEGGERAVARGGSADGEGEEGGEPAPDGSGYVVPGGVGEPSRAAGPMAAPRYPTARSLRPGSPYAVDVRPEDAAGTEGDGTTGAEGADGEAAPAAAPRPAAPTGPLARAFGEERVHGGRAYTMRFNRRIQGIRGRAAGNGFAIHVEGAIAVDRAGPIAVRDADVVRANVVNTGSTSELTIEFHERVQYPRYRVVARGSNLEITVGRATAEEIAVIRRQEARARREARAAAASGGATADGDEGAAPRTTPMIERAPRAPRAPGAVAAAGGRARAAGAAAAGVRGPGAAGRAAAAAPGRPGAARAAAGAPAGRGALARGPAARGPAGAAGRGPAGRAAAAAPARPGARAAAGAGARGPAARAGGPRPRAANPR